jgi:hypothetical protein
VAGFVAELGLKLRAVIEPRLKRAFEEIERAFGFGRDFIGGKRRRRSVRDALRCGTADDDCEQETRGARHAAIERTRPRRVECIRTRVA